MVLLKKAILGNPVVLLGICLLVFGFASILINAFSATKRGEKNKYGIRERSSNRKYSKQALAVILIAMVIGLIVVINRLNKIKKINHREHKEESQRISVPSV